MSNRDNNPLTSGNSMRASMELGRRLRARIVEVARTAGPRGITLSEAVASIPEHKATSVTPRFIELIKRGQLVRVCLQTKKPNEHSPIGKPCYVTRFDEQTRRHVLVHWVPESAPKTPAESADDPELSQPCNAGTENSAERSKK